ncbi:MAG: BTAD domain-containing putative transcriptional regulator [Capsulimonadales bacterium]|nr:BTAD domain-containing putative transcriptional regulator [Capsulimonadales bacterium]
MTAELTGAVGTDSVVLTKFRTRKTAQLLGYLALHAGKRSGPSTGFGRDALTEILWPDSDPIAGRNRLKQEIAALRRQLEPPGVPAGSVLMADRFSVCLNPTAITTDVAGFERHLFTAAHTETIRERIEILRKALDLYRDDLLNDFYEDWISEPREHLREQYMEALLRLSDQEMADGDLTAAQESVRRVVHKDPLREEAQVRLIRLLVASGKMAEARRQYDSWANALETELAETPTIPFATLSAEGRLSPPPSKGTSLPAKRAEISTMPETAPTPALYLPMHFTRFFGRQEEIERIRKIVCGSLGRLVTLTGAGGIGKTRLALEAARGVTNAFPGGVYFVPLASLTDATNVPETILRTLGVETEAETDVLTLTARELTRREPCLLLLDNMEHLMESGIIATVRSLREKARGVTFLATSRIRPDLEGEVEVVVAPLPVPTATGPPEQLLEWESVRLFTDRARLANQDFQVTVRNAAAVAELCRHLDGVPLAIELAAAWSRTLTPRQMCESLARSSELLVSRRRDLSERHRSLTETVEWSYNLLPEAERRAFAELGVFVGTFSLHDAEAVRAEANTLNRIESLQRYSLIYRAHSDANEAQYRLLEPLREFACERLKAFPDREEGVRRRHFEHFARFARLWRTCFYTPTEADALVALEAHSDNLREAMETAIRAGAFLEAADLALALCGVSQRRGFTEPAILAVETGLQALRVQKEPFPQAYARLLRERAGLHLDRNEPEAAERLAEEALNIPVEEPVERGLTLNILAQARLVRKEFAGARRTLADAAMLAERANDPILTGITCNNRGLVERRDPDGDRERAERYFREALRAHQERGNLRGAGSSFNNLGVIAHQRGDLAVAGAFYREALACERKVGHSFGIGRALNNLAEVAEGQRELEAARRLFAAAERIFALLQSSFHTYTANLLEALTAKAGDAGKTALLRREAAALSVESLCEWAFFSP